VGTRTVAWAGAESRLVGEWLAQRWPGRRTLQHVRLGRLPDGLDTTGLSPSELTALGVYRRYCDALIVDPPTLWVAEAMIVPKPGKVSQLELYIELLPDTPELGPLLSLAPRGVLVSAVDDPTLARMCAKRNLNWQLFTPAWVGSYLLSLAPRHRQPSLPQ